MATDSWIRETRPKVSVSPCVTLKVWLFAPDPINPNRKTLQSISGYGCIFRSLITDEKIMSIRRCKGRSKERPELPGLDDLLTKNKPALNAFLRCEVLLISVDDTFLPLEVLGCHKGDVFDDPFHMRWIERISSQICSAKGDTP